MARPVSYKFPYALLGKPYAEAKMSGSALAPKISGTVSFYPIDNGTLIAAEITGLPPHTPGSASSPPIGPFGFHLHDGSACQNAMGSDPFASAMGHYNPGDQQHPDHAGDFPVLFSNNGYTVYDLGRDVPLDKFVDEQLKTDSELVCLSAMMTTSMVGMPKVIEKIKAKNPNCMIMIGGAPTSKELADKWGADGYAEDASNALKEAIKMVSFLKKLRDEKAAKK